MSTKNKIGNSVHLQPTQNSYQRRAYAHSPTHWSSHSYVDGIVAVFYTKPAPVCLDKQTNRKQTHNHTQHTITHIQHTNERTNERMNARTNTRQTNTLQMQTLVFFATRCVHSGQSNAVPVAEKRHCSTQLGGAVASPSVWSKLAPSA
jgi:hypothetical protein